jgi:hypothetical protein
MVYSCNITVADAASERKFEQRYLEAMAMPRPSWTARSPRGQTVTIEHDPYRKTWRVTPGGYERRRLEHAIAQATGDAATSPWIAQLAQRLTDAVAARSAEPEVEAAPAEAGAADPVAPPEPLTRFPKLRWSRLGRRDGR